MRMVNRSAGGSGGAAHAAATTNDAAHTLDIIGPAYS